MVKIGICGHFGGGHTFLDGQTVKTKIVTDELRKQFGENEVLAVDTYGGIKTIWRHMFGLIRLTKCCKNILIFPAHNSLRVYVPMLSFLRWFFKGRKFHYIVIGGWLADFLKNRPVLTAQLKRFDGIYVETNTMKKALEQMDFQNVFVMPNCKDLKIIKKEELVFPTSLPLKLCTFSRVMKEKGIEDAVDAVTAVNRYFNKTVYQLDIYGQVDSSQIEWFEQLKSRFPEYIRYGGLVPFDQSVQVLKNCFALLFPTRFFTEGIPGTIIDAYAAGVPVISARWQSFYDIVDDATTGIGYEFDHYQSLKDVLISAYQNQEQWMMMKYNCIERANHYLPENVIKILSANIV